MFIFLPKSTETMNFLRPEPDNFDLHLSALTLGDTTPPKSLRNYGLLDMSNILSLP